MGNLDKRLNNLERVIKPTDRLVIIWIDDPQHVTVTIDGVNEQMTLAEAEAKYPNGPGDVRISWGEMEEEYHNRSMHAFADAIEEIIEGKK